MDAVGEKADRSVGPMHWDIFRAPFVARHEA